MTDRYRNDNQAPRLLIDPAAIAARLETLSTSPLCDGCAAGVVPVTADTAALLIEAIRLAETLAAARLESANRLAAIRAALHAAREGEAEPLAYLRDELPAETDGGWCS
jgi:uncharacterized protein YggE